MDDYDDEFKNMECDESLWPDKMYEVLESREILFPQNMKSLIKEVAYKFYYLGMIKREIAAELDISLGQVRGLLQTYKKQIKRKNKKMIKPKELTPEKDEYIQRLKDEVKVLQKMVNGLSDMEDISVVSSLKIGKFYTKRIKEIKEKIKEMGNG